MSHNKEAIETNKAPKAIGPYSQAISQGPFIFCSGQIAIDYSTGKLTESGIEKQTKLVLKNLQAVLEVKNLKLDSVVMTRIYLKDFKDFQAVNEVYSHFFKAPHPARATIGVKELPLGALVEIEAIAMKNS